MGWGFLAGGALAITTIATAAAAATLGVGAGSFAHPHYAEGRTKTIMVWYYRPEGAAADARVVFVMHGRGRDGENYRKAWIPHADPGKFVLLVPEFSRTDFGETRHYQFGHVVTESGAPVPEREWSFTAIEDIFDAVKRANGLSADRYDIYGHSAGGQFVHRMVLFKPSARYRLAIAANSGSYTMLDRSLPYPYGLSGAEDASRQLPSTLGRRLIVLLGEQDNDPNHPSLPRTPEAMQQGAHRFARGQAFYKRSKEAADGLKATLNWSLETAPGVGHSNTRMAPRAAALLADKR